METTGPGTDAPQQPVTPEPDLKDWTWVLERPCPECGSAAGDVAPTDLGAAVRATVPRWHSALARPDARVRPTPTTWSPTEYGAHVRDVLRVFTGRLELMLERDAPTFPNWDQDATALAERYDLADPVVVAAEIAAAAEVAAAAFDAVREDQWDRTGLRSNGSHFTVASLGAYFLHDLRHHLHDVGA
ncbi:DinB family protein [Cellulomonas endophytica]|uniref:DinB family protein n=1 Tax=Cellulomonas endophytica TaxID=2494735 RepID=UPI0010122439|nr:DinB family protein [Cellulomonas endophytica]